MIVVESRVNDTNLYTLASKTLCVELVNPAHFVSGESVRWEGIVVWSGDNVGVW
jgi:hypothetical protein